jgi:hypothetical protein
MATMTTASSSSSASTKFSSARSALPEGFKCVGSAKEAHGQQIYCVAWSQDLYQDNEGKALQCFATCGGNVVSVYEVHEDDSAATKKPNIVLRQGYVDPKEDEAFYACVFWWEITWPGLLDLDHSILLGRRL